MPDQLLSNDGTCPIELIQGQPFNLEIQCEQPAEGGGYEAMNNAGWSGRAQMRDSPGGRLLLTFDVDVSQDEDGPNKGKIYVAATGNQTALLKRKGWWDLEINDGLGNNESVIKLSPATLIRQVTA